MTPKLLLADDSVTIQRVIELTFADEDVQVIAVGDGRAALERVKTDPPDIVLADVGMPERDGYEVAEFIKNDPGLRHIPVLLLTGAFEPVDDARAKAIGCEGVLVKPFEPQMVINRVRELLSPSRSAAPALAGLPLSAVPVEPVAGAGPEPAAAPPVANEPAARTDSQAAADSLPPAETTAPAAASGDALENYFDRLDAALANFGPPAPAGGEHAAAGAPEVPVTEIRDDDAGTAAADGSSGLLPPLHAAFAALLAAERGEPVAIPVPFREPLSEAAIEEIATRVIARMGDAKMRALVLDTAERLVREEIDRIKNHR